MECDVTHTEVADSTFLRDFGKFLLDSTVQNMEMFLLVLFLLILYLYTEIFNNPISHYTRMITN
jgi:hypothetical protein